MSVSNNSDANQLLASLFPKVLDTPSDIIIAKMRMVNL